MKSNSSEVLFEEFLGYKALFLGYLFPFAIFVFVFFLLLWLIQKEDTAGIMAILSIFLYYFILFLFRKKFAGVFNLHLKK